MLVQDIFIAFFLCQTSDVFLIIFSINSESYLPYQIVIKVLNFRREYFLTKTIPQYVCKHFQYTDTYIA